jgi:putative peptidoglycan lipid II flippase
VAVLYAQRRLAVTAMAPIGLTIVVVAAMGAFRLLAGPHAGLDLTTGERLVLAPAGRSASPPSWGSRPSRFWRSGFRLVPRLGRRDPVGRALRLSGWAVLAAQPDRRCSSPPSWGTASLAARSCTRPRIFFLAPYAVLAQPVHTAILPTGRERDAPDQFATSLRWALDNMALLIIPVTAGLLAVTAAHARRRLRPGHAPGGVGCSAGLASFAVGLYTYSAFLLFARALREARVAHRRSSPSSLRLSASGVMVTGGARARGARP